MGHDKLDFWRWAIGHELLTAGESLSAPCFAGIKRPEKGYYLPGANFDAIGGFCRKPNISVAPVAQRYLVTL